MRKLEPCRSAWRKGPGAWEAAGWPGSSPALPGRAGSQALAQPRAKPHFLPGKACPLREAGAAASWGPGCCLQSGPDGRASCGLSRGPCGGGAVWPGDSSSSPSDPGVCSWKEPCGPELALTPQSTGGATGPRTAVPGKRAPSGLGLIPSTRKGGRHRGGELLNQLAVPPWPEPQEESPGQTGGQAGAKAAGRDAHVGSGGRVAGQTPHLCAVSFR